MLYNALKEEKAMRAPCEARCECLEVDNIWELTRKNKHPTLDWNPAMVIPVWKYSPPWETYE